MGSLVFCIHHKQGCKWSDELRKLKVIIPPLQAAIRRRRSTPCDHPPPPPAGQKRHRRQPQPVAIARIGFMATLRAAQFTYFSSRLFWAEREAIKNARSHSQSDRIDRGTASSSLGGQCAPGQTKFVFSVPFLFLCGLGKMFGCYRQLSASA